MKITKKIKQNLFHIFKLTCTKTGLLGIILWQIYYYRSIRGKVPNLIHPKDLSEYIYKTIRSKKCNRRFADLADKIKVREYVTSKGLSDCLFNIYGIWNNAKDIDFSRLPNKFALKTNNGCGNHYFCNNKDNININKLVEETNQTLALKNHNFAFEPHYKLIEPKIYCEELIEGSSSIVDYKFLCVNGNIEAILVVYNRVNNKYNLELFDENWNPMNGLIENYKVTKHIDKPKCFERMKEVARILSSDFRFVRVDLYDYRDKVYFGELTFTPQGGHLKYFTTEFIQQIGNLVNNKKEK